MNTSVSLELAKCLKDKGINFPCEKRYNELGELTATKLDMNMQPNNYSNSYAAPTIFEVVMWIYKKHEFWCYTYTNGKIWHPCIQHKFGDMAVLSGKIGNYNSPEESFEAAIKYCLTELI